MYLPVIELWLHGRRAAERYVQHLCDDQPSQNIESEDDGHLLQQVHQVVSPSAPPLVVLSLCRYLRVIFVIIITIIFDIFIGTFFVSAFIADYHHHQSPKCHQNQSSQDIQHGRDFCG